MVEPVAPAQGSQFEVVGAAPGSFPVHESGCTNPMAVSARALMLRCESPPPRRQPASLDWSGVSGCWVEVDGVSEGLELGDEFPGVLLLAGAAAGPVGAGLLVVEVVVDDVPVGDEDVVAGGADRFGQPTSAADLGVMRGQVGALRAGRGVRGLGQRCAERDRVVSGVPGAALATGGVVPGQIPAQLARCAAVGNTDMSAPHSASSMIAVRWATPGMVATRFRIG